LDYVGQTIVKSPLSIYARFNKSVTSRARVFGYGAQRNLIALANSEDFVLGLAWEFAQAGGRKDDGMSGSGEIARILIGLGLFLAVVGVIIGAAGRFLNLGRLPGDILVRRGNFTFYFPLATCLLLSVALTVLLWMLRRR
jgi:hypothetical protein